MTSPAYDSAPGGSMSFLDQVVLTGDPVVSTTLAPWTVQTTTGTA
ncbi:hypothetical protein [Cellulomonas xiejunii]|uniref:Uncharacterized protein n=1 Tax=Cellulomonas xiejunii TaxID=2968083 RepID=A0ABY5KSX1_9CELL|nr:hypothetical protein [Cellulomonas xiejunii]UUI72322.1 hypothetical protein NP048_02305 [Cellulomonas xiejunii]